MSIASGGAAHVALRLGLEAKKLQAEAIAASNAAREIPLERLAEKQAKFEEAESKSVDARAKLAELTRLTERSSSPRCPLASVSAIKGEAGFRADPSELRGSGAAAGAAGGAK